MPNPAVIDKKQLEQLIQANWSKFVDKIALLKNVLDHARNAQYSTVITERVPVQQIKITVTKVCVIELGTMEIWIEFSVPVDGGMAIGTHIYHMMINKMCELNLYDTYGTIFIDRKQDAAT